jgi:hypothetical protein
MKRTRLLHFAGLTALALGITYSAISLAMVVTPPTPPPATPEAAATPTPATLPGPATTTADGAPIDQARLVAGLEVFKEGGCRGCHGWAANGEREGPNPEGPSLRATMLPLEWIGITIACGRPGTAMPYYSRDVYRRDSTTCYGQTPAQIGDRMPIRAGVRFTQQEVDDLAYYIEYFVKGRAEVTRTECEFYYGAGDARCAAYPAP